MKFRFILFLPILFVSCAQQQTIQAQESTNPASQPKLIVGLIIDQMRYDYLYKYWEDYGDDGFKRLMNNGFVAHDHHFNFAPTFTGPGHASVYTGTTPKHHGVIGNDWWDIKTKAMIYCVTDNNVSGTGTSLPSGKMSPHRMLTTTLGDELELATNGRSKTIGISLKDRGAILPVGHSGDAAYWYNGINEGKWVSSSWYLKSLPTWVNEVNASGRSDELMNEGWQLLKDASAYDESLPDNNPYEGKFAGRANSTFPYDLRTLAKDSLNNNYDLLKATPAGNVLTFDMARAAVKSENMGQDEHPDLLAISISSPDYVGHKFGPASMEMQDIFLRLDQELGKFLSFLDSEVGTDNYTLFLTADHGGVHVPSYLQSLQIPANYWQPGNMIEDAKAALKAKFGDGEIIVNYSNDQFFFDRKLLQSKGIDREECEGIVAEVARNTNGVSFVLTRENMLEHEYHEGIRALIDKGYHSARSGDVVVVTEPAWILYGRVGTTHGSPYSYDTHVPLIMYGYGVEAGNYYGETSVEDIAPSICSMYKIQFPNGCTGHPIRKSISSKLK